MKSGVLTLNAGSSSIKLAAFFVNDGVLCADPAIKAQISGLGDAPVITIMADGEKRREEPIGGGRALDNNGAIKYLLDAVENLLTGIDILGVGHRIVHGGAKFSKPQIMTPAIINYLQQLTPLAPSHQPANLLGAAAAGKRWPNVAQVACFDTMFHQTQPDIAAQFALPRKMMEDGIVRYGFHGLSYEYIASAAANMLGRSPHGRMIVAHLGAGASMCAIRDGKSVATTMGFTALDGLPMGTRCGAIDPGVLLFLLQEKSMSVTDLSDMLYSQSGLLGLSEISSDMRVLEESADPRAEEAIAHFVYRSVREIGSLAAALGGLDALIFTAGIGENSANVRARILSGLAWLGFEVDDRANAQHAHCITTQGSKSSAWVIPTNEELMMARHALQLAAPRS